MPRAITELALRLAALQRRRPVVGDVVLVGVLLLLLVPARIGDLENTADARLISVALFLPLLARRRWPLAVFATVTLVGAVQWLLDVRAVGDAALLVALYTVAVTQPIRRAAPAFAIIEAGVVLAALHWGVNETDTLHAMVGLTGMATAAAVLGTSTQSRRALVLSLQERADRLQVERDQQGRLSAAAERARIAREMHDIVAHNVSVMIALADGASYAVHDDPARAADAMQRSSQTGRQALTEMRRLLGVLREGDGERQDLAPQPGVAQIDALVEQVRTAGLPVSYTTDGLPGDLPPGLQLAVYRIVQEALTNTLKHAGRAASATLRISHRDDVLEVLVADDGGAGEPGAFSAGAGLRGMSERAAVYEGAVDVGPRAGGGWRVRVRIPLHRTPVTA